MAEPCHLAGTAKAISSACPDKVKPSSEDELLPPGRALAWDSGHPAWHGWPGTQLILGWTTSGKPLSLVNINLHPKEASISSPTIMFF